MFKILTAIPHSQVPLLTFLLFLLNIFQWFLRPQWSHFHIHHSKENCFSTKRISSCTTGMPLLFHRLFNETSSYLHHEYTFKLDVYILEANEFDSLWLWFYYVCEGINWSLEETIWFTWIGVTCYQRIPKNVICTMVWNINRSWTYILKAVNAEKKE